MQRYTIFFIVVSALHVSSGVSAHHQELKNCTCGIAYLSNLFAATANVGEFRDAACTVFELLMMRGKPARNMYSTDMPQVQFLAPDEERKNRSKHVQH